MSSSQFLTGFGEKKNCHRGEKKNCFLLLLHTYPYIPDNDRKNKRSLVFPEYVRTILLLKYGNSNKLCEISGNVNN